MRQIVLLQIFHIFNLSISWGADLWSVEGVNSNSKHNCIIFIHKIYCNCKQRWPLYSFLSWERISQSLEGSNTNWHFYNLSIAEMAVKALICKTPINECALQLIGAIQFALSFLSCFIGRANDALYYMQQSAKISRHVPYQSSATFWSRFCRKNYKNDSPTDANGKSINAAIVFGSEFKFFIYIEMVYRFLAFVRNLALSGLGDGERPKSVCFCLFNPSL